MNAVKGAIAKIRQGVLLVDKIRIYKNVYVCVEVSNDWSLSNHVRKNAYCWLIGMNEHGKFFDTMYMDIDRVIGIFPAGAYPFGSQEKFRGIVKTSNFMAAYFVREMERGSPAP